MSGYMPLMRCSVGPEVVSVPREECLLAHDASIIQSALGSGLLAALAWDQNILNVFNENSSRKEIHRF